MFSQLVIPQTQRTAYGSVWKGERERKLSQPSVGRAESVSVFCRWKHGYDNLEGLPYFFKCKVRTHFFPVKM